jgi:hypothetical protein
MDAVQMEDPQYSELDNSYRVSFRSWASRVEQLHQLEDQHSPPAEVASAETEAALAERAYRDNRNRLVQFILVASTHSSVPRRLTPAQHQEVERLAYRLWEEGGRREGTAEDDWYRAERLLFGQH